MVAKYLYAEEEFPIFSVRDTPAHAAHKPIDPELTDDELKYIARARGEYLRMQEWLAGKDKNVS